MAIPTRIDIMPAVSQASSLYYTGGGTNYIVETPLGVKYLFYRDAASDPVFVKSLDGGVTWGTGTALKGISATQISVWYQRWTDPTGTLGDKIWVAYTDSGADDVYIRSVDTANSDALGTEYVVFAGYSTAVGGALSIAQMIGGNLICVGCIDAGTEVFSRKSTDSGANWSDIAAGYEANADLCIVMPGWGADNQDAMMFYYDRTATEVSVKYFDDSGNSWSEDSLATSISIPDHTTYSLGHISATVDHTNSKNLCAFWTAVDSANADLRVFSCSQSAQTETAANVVLNSTDDQAFAGISIFGSTWYVFYCGSSDGLQSYSDVLSVFYKTSTDAGANWSAETNLSIMRRLVSYLFTIPICYKSTGLMTYTANTLMYNAPLTIPRTTFQLGM